MFKVNLEASLLLSMHRKENAQTLGAGRYLQGRDFLQPCAYHGPHPKCLDKYSSYPCSQSHHQRSLDTGRHQWHHSRGEEEAQEMAWPCILYEEGLPSICSTDMGSTWEEGQRLTFGYLETDNGGRDGGSRELLEWSLKAMEAEMEEAGSSWNEVWRQLRQRWRKQGAPRMKSNGLP